MFCRQCGSQLPLAATFCDVCGSTAAEPRPVTPNNPQPTRPLQDDSDFVTRIHVEPKAERDKIPLALAAVFAAGILLLLGVIIGIFVIDYFSSKESPPSVVQTKRTATPVPTFMPTITPPPQRESAPPPIPAPTIVESIGACDEGASPRDGYMHRVKFERGAYSKTICAYRDGVHLQRYVVSARAGQWLWVKTESTEYNQFGIEDVATGIQISSTGIETDWRGQVPTTSDYQIIVAGSPSEYKLFISIK